MIEVGLGSYQLEIATEFGPRVMGLRRDDGPQVLARPGGDAGNEPPNGVYRFRGGHRLWAAPEIAEITYAADDHECSVEEVDGAVTITGPSDDAQLVKEITIRADEGALMLEHTIRRHSGRGPELAAWAITQLPLGGTAILPLIGPLTAPLPNRQLVLWPYTSMTDQRLGFGDVAISVSADEGPPLKLGAGASSRRLGYLRGGQLFLKEIMSKPLGTVPDFGAALQVYVGQGFCELETLGGMVEVSNTRPAILTERWTVLGCDDVEVARRMAVNSNKT